jgi:hypothetical protein
MKIYFFRNEGVQDLSRGGEAPEKGSDHFFRHLHDFL